VRWARLIPECAEIPYAFSEFNGGVILYGASVAARRFLALWREFFERYSETTLGWDQASLRIAAWQSEAQIHTLPVEFNVRSASSRRRARKLVARGEEPELLRPRIWHWRGVHRRRGLSGWLNLGRRPYRY